jgi:hypothetical protein
MMLLSGYRMSVGIGSSNTNRNDMIIGMILIAIGGIVVGWALGSKWQISVYQPVVNEMYQIITDLTGHSEIGQEIMERINKHKL